MIASWTVNGAVLEWDRNAEPEVAGYRAYQGTRSRSYTAVFDVGNNTTANLSNLTPGETYYFAVTAYTADGLESDFSEEVSYTVPGNPVVANVAPIAMADGYSTPAGVPLAVNAAVGVLANDFDADGDRLTAALVVAPANGIVSLAADGSFSYVPNPTFVGLDVFTYQISDGKASSGVAAVSVTVTGNVNRSPVAVAESYVTAKKTALLVNAANGVLANDFDADGDVLTALLAAGPSRGKITLSSNGAFTYTPNGGSSGADSFSYRATDGKATSAVCVVAITVGQQVPALASMAMIEPAAADVAVTGESSDDDLDGRALRLTFRENGKLITRIARFAGDSFTTEMLDGEVVSRGRFFFNRKSRTKASLLLADESGALEEYLVTMGTRRWRGRRIGD